MVIAVNMATVPIVLQYLDIKHFGLWTAITSLATWILLFDFGLVNGLVNAISEAYGRNDRQSARVYVSTAFYLLVAISGILLIVSLLIAPRLNWDSIIGVTGSISPDVVRWSILAAIVPILVGMPLSLIRQIYAGYQKTYTFMIFSMVGSVATLCLIIWAVHTKASLPTLIFAAGCGAVAAYVLNWIYMVRIEMPWLAPGLRMCSREGLRRLLQTSVPLFCFQIGSLLINQSQPIILAHRTNLETVAEYSILLKLWAVITSLIILGTNAFLPSFREAYERGDSAWLRRAFKHMLKIRMAMAFCGSVLMVVCGNWILKLWLHTMDVRFDLTVWIACAISVLVTTWVTSFTDFLTIMDTIWIQVGLVLLNGAVTVALTFLLAPQFGVLGAVVALGSVSVVVLSWLVPRVAYSLLSEKPALRAAS